MGGMCLGSLALPRIISARRHPLRVYALLELGIGIIGIAVLFGCRLSADLHDPRWARSAGDPAARGGQRRYVCCRPPC